MKYTKIIVSLLLSLVALGASADKLSPDTRMHLNERAKTMKINSTDADELPSLKVFVALEEGYSVNDIQIPGVEVQSAFLSAVTASVTAQAIDALTKLDAVRYIQIASDVRLCNDFGRRDLKVDYVHKNLGGMLPQAYTGKDVIVGIIDTGVEYGHRAFYSSDGKQLRIKRVWNQNQNGVAPEGYTYGKEFTNEADILLATYDTAREYHGSHTMGTAAGGGNLQTKYYGMAPDADIVFVSFKNEDNTTIADAIKYIFDYADSQGRPCVINMSLGSHHGPHDGSSYLDQIIDEMSGPGHIIVGACGNEGEVRMHASKTFTESDKTFKTMLTFNSGVSHKLHYIDIWGSEGSNLKLNMAIFNSLKGQVVTRSDVFDTANPNPNGLIYYTYLDENGADLDCLVSGEVNPENNCPHIYVRCQVGDLGTSRMPGLLIQGDPGATVNMWSEGGHEFSSNSLKGFTNGDNAMTVGEIGGTANRIITVGSYDGRDTVLFEHGTKYLLMSNTPYPYKMYDHSTFSSLGPTADGRTVPTVCAPGMPVISAINRYYSGLTDPTIETCDYTTDTSGRNYYYMYNMGTSMSAPHVAGVIALMLQANPDLTPEDAKQIIQETADTWTAMGELPNNSWGAGRINALECVRRAVAMNGIQSITDADVDMESTQVWGENGAVKVSTPSVGSTVRIYNLSGMLLCEKTLTDTYTTIDASGWGHGVYVAEVTGKNSRNSFKIAL